MCRLFGLHAGRPVTATFWLLDAPDSLAAQSRRNPDGTGLGVFGSDGQPVVRKQPIAAWRDIAFATEAREISGTTFIAHVRYATTGPAEEVNTHPFLQDGRIFAHNGVVEGLDLLDARLRQLGGADLVRGDTDSERVFALITTSIRGQDGDVGAGLEEALHWLAENVPTLPIPAPLLVGQGEDDSLVTAAAQAGWVAQRCAAGQQVDYRTYPGRNHVPLVEADSALVPDLLDWTRARFAGEQVTAGCTTSRR